MTWVLFLNDMRQPKIEYLTPVARADCRAALEGLLRREAVEPYRDGQWGKHFRQGGMLEWYNPPFSHRRDEEFKEVGSAEDWAQRARQAWQDQVAPLPDVSR